MTKYRSFSDVPTRCRSLTNAYNVAFEGASDAAGLPLGVIWNEERYGNAVTGEPNSTGTGECVECGKRVVVYLNYEKIGEQVYTLDCPKMRITVSGHPCKEKRG